MPASRVAPSARPRLAQLPDQSLEPNAQEERSLEPLAAAAVARLDRRLAFSPDEVAEQLGLCRATVYNLMRRGELRYSSIGRRRRIPRSEVERLAGMGGAEA